MRLNQLKNVLHGLDYDGSRIHWNYNNWVQNLDNRIRAQLSTL